jgi:hypothetical protein
MVERSDSLLVEISAPLFQRGGIAKSGGESCAAALSAVDGTLD